MRKTVRRRHNKDGSVTTTTTYSRKNIFGTRVVDTYVSKSPASSNSSSAATAKINFDQTNNKYSRILTNFSIRCFILSLIFNIIIPFFIFKNAKDNSTTFENFMDIYGGIFIFFLFVFVIGLVYQVGYFKRRNKWIKENNIKKADEGSTVANGLSSLKNNQSDIVNQNVSNINSEVNEIVNAIKKSEEIRAAYKLQQERQLSVPGDEITSKDFDLTNTIKTAPSSNNSVPPQIDMSALLREEDVRQAAVYAVEAGSAGVSTAYIQRKVNVGYARAARIIDMLEGMGIIGPFEGAKPRRVLVDKEWLNQKLEECMFENKE